MSKRKIIAAAIIAILVILVIIIIVIIISHRHKVKGWQIAVGDIDSNGITNDIFTDMNLSDCQAKCTATPDCDFLSYNSDSQTCYLKAGDTSISGCTSGIYYMNKKGKFEWYTLPGMIDYITTSTPTTQTSASACQQAAITGKKNLFSYNSTNNDCYIGGTDTSSGNVISFDV